MTTHRPTKRPECGDPQRRRCKPPHQARAARPRAQAARPQHRRKTPRAQAARPRHRRKPHRARAARRPRPRQRNSTGSTTTTATRPTWSWRRRVVTDRPSETSRARSRELVRARLRCASFDPRADWERAGIARSSALVDDQQERSLQRVRALRLPKTVSARRLRPIRVSDARPLPAALAEF